MSGGGGWRWWWCRSCLNERPVRCGRAEVNYVRGGGRGVQHSPIPGTQVVARCAVPTRSIVRARLVPGSSEHGATLDRVELGLLECRCFCDAG